MPLRNIKIQVDSLAWRTQQINKQFPLFLSSRPRCQAEFTYIESGLITGFPRFEFVLSIGTRQRRYTP